MDKVYFVSWCLIGVVVVCSGQHKHETHRSARDVTGTFPADDPITVEITNFLDNIREIRALSTLQEIQNKVGDINDYVTDNLRTTTKYLSDLAGNDGSSDITQQAASLVHIIESLGYLLGLDMQSDESRRLSMNSVTIYVSNSHVTKFKGLHFSQDGGQSVISIPNSASFPPSTSDVISVSYCVSDVTNIMPKMSNSSLGSDVISTTFLDGSGHVLSLTIKDPVFLEMTLDTSAIDDKQPMCAFLEYGEDGTGSWSTSGCDTVYPVSGQDGVVHCHCTHLSTYGVILTEKIAHTRIGVAAWIGCSITILFCVLTALVFIGYRLMNTTRCYIRFSFLTALALAEMLFLSITYKESPAICTMVALGIHFFVTSSFAWLLSYALFLGNDLTGDLEASLHIAHYTFLGWAIPFVVVLITFIWKYDSYVQEEYCWISQTTDGLRYAYIIPIAILTVATLCVLMYDINVHISITDPKRQTMLTVAKSGLRSCCCLLPVLAAVWILADFVVIEGNLWLQILLSVLNIILGVIVFLIMFYFNEEVMMKRKNGTVKRFAKRFKRTRPDSDDEVAPHATEMNIVLGGFSSRPSTSRDTESSRPRPQYATPLSSPQKSSPATISNTDDRARIIPVETPASPNRRSYDMTEAKYKFLFGSHDSGAGTI